MKTLPDGTLEIPAWAHRTSMLALGDAHRPDDPEALADRLLFSERIARYCWAYDERRREALADCFTQDAIWEGNVLGQIAIGPFVGREKIVAWLTEFWPYQHDQRRHMILNTIVEHQSAQTATTFSYLLLMSSDGKAVKLESTGFYRTEYRPVGAAWRIAKLSAGFDAPFWPGNLDQMSERGRVRHGVAVSKDEKSD